uniref:Asp_protease domain-containing protein n=1 Tax=Globodera pallida TaxID=36090 RepID=A0A183C6D1_GLOPA
MRLTIIAGEHVSSLEISPDMEMENFLALCKLELPSIANAPIEKLALTCSGRNFIANAGLAKKRLQELNIRDEDAIHFELISASSTSQTPYSSRSTPSSLSTKSAPLQTSTLISSLVQNIKVPKQHSVADDRAMADQIFSMLVEPARLDFLRVDHPDLVAAFEANPTDKDAFFTAFKKNKEEQLRRVRLMYDQNSEEGQEIERERIVRMQELAMEHMPEAFIPVNMLYIRMMINNHPVIAFVDSGAQSSILSESCARRCDILKYVDRHYRVQAVGIGGSQKMVGRIFACQVQVHEHIFACPFEVMADRDIDILFGLNAMLRHRCCIDLAKMVLRFGDGTETPFLSEQEVEREKQTIALAEVMETAEGTMEETKKN